VEQRAKRTHLDGVASVAQQREAELLLDGLQQGVVAGEAGIDAMPDAAGYHDHRNAATAVHGAAEQVAAAAGGFGRDRGQDRGVRARAGYRRAPRPASGISSTR